MQGLDTVPPGQRQRANLASVAALHELEAEVMHKKGVLNRRREGKTDFYAPKLDRDEFMALRAGAEVEGLVAQYGDVALSHVARQVASLDPARRRALQRLARKS